MGFHNSSRKLNLLHWLGLALLATLSSATCSQHDSGSFAVDDGAASVSELNEVSPASYGTIKKPKERPVSTESGSYPPAQHQLSASQAW